MRIYPFNLFFYFCPVSYLLERAQDKISWYCFVICFDKTKHYVVIAKHKTDWYPKLFIQNKYLLKMQIATKCRAGKKQKSSNLIIQQFYNLQHSQTVPRECKWSRALFQFRFVLFYEVRVLQFIVTAWQETKSSNIAFSYRSCE